VAGGIEKSGSAHRQQPPPQARAELVATATIWRQIGDNPVGTAGQLPRTGRDLAFNPEEGARAQL